MVLLVSSSMGICGFRDSIEHLGFETTNAKISIVEFLVLQSTRRYSMTFGMRLY